MEIKIIREKISLDELKKLSSYEEMIKAVVDIEKEIIAVGGELHADAMEKLIEDGSSPQNVWGINIHLNEPKKNWLEFYSLINIRPTQNNRSMEIQDDKIKGKIREIVDKLIGI